MRNNETAGISCEVAIADAFGVSINPDYRRRADEKIVEKVRPLVRDIFSQYNIPIPVKHCAEKQNPIDFILEDNTTLSVKSNIGALGKVAPQIIGQATVKSFFEYFIDSINEYYPDINVDILSEDEKRHLFKELALNYTDKLIYEYWDKLFHTDYYLHFYNIRNNDIGSLCLEKLPPHYFENDNFSFTRGIDTWNEGSTVKYNGVTIGEFQVHNHRNCLKFRFNMGGLQKLSLFDKK